MPTTPLPPPTPFPSPTRLPPGPDTAAADSEWVTGYILGPEYGGLFQVGATSLGRRLPDLALLPASDDVARTLAAVPPGDTLLHLAGHLLPADGDVLTFQVTAVMPVNYYYAPDTPPGGDPVPG